jgi:hypothetical protein
LRVGARRRPISQRQIARAISIVEGERLTVDDEGKLCSGLTEGRGRIMNA